MRVVGEIDRRRRSGVADRPAYGKGECVVSGKHSREKDGRQPTTSRIISSRAQHDGSCSITKNGSVVVTKLDHETE